MQVIAAEGLEFFWSSWVNALVIPYPSKEAHLDTQRETGMEFRLLHNIEPLLAWRTFGSYKGCSPAGAGITLSLSHVIPQQL